MRGCGLVLVLALVPCTLCLVYASDAGEAQVGAAGDATSLSTAVADAAVPSTTAFSMALERVNALAESTTGTAVNEYRPRPVQLVRPSEDGSGLEVVPEGLAYLRNLTVPLHVVGVVGPYHGGKSFLMNQIMGVHGFKTATDVDPTTKGIWTWSVPATVDGGAFAVLFLDTEGFGASDVTADYDAKVFAVSSLFSSYLLYNSVRNIDQAAIDYLELLARRTQLFQFRTAVTKDAAKAQLNPAALFPLPPLTWVIEDFFTPTVAGETPTQWLMRLLSKPHKDADAPDQESSLADIFPSIDCKTLFLPSVSKELLEDLSKAGPEDMTSEFLDGIRDLSNHISNQLLAQAPLRNGPQLAALLEVLVQASSTGAFSRVPSMWNLFIQSQLEQASDASTKCFSIGLAPSLETSPPTPLNTFNTISDEVMASCSALYKSLLFGMPEDVRSNALLTQTAVMEETMREKLTQLQHKIGKHCDSTAAAVKDLVFEFVAARSFPTPCTAFEKDLDATIATTARPMEEAVSMYGAVCEERLKTLKVDLQHVKGSALGENLAAHRENLQRAATEGRSVFTSTVNDRFVGLGSDEAFAVKELDELLQDAQDRATATFARAAIVSKDTNLYDTFASGLVSSSMLNHERERNSKLVLDITTRTAVKIGDEVAATLLAVRLPIHLKTLVDLSTKHAQDALSRFDSEVARFRGHAAVDEVRRTLQDDLKESEGEFKHRNTQAYGRIFREPLKVAFKLIRAEAKSSWSSFLLRRTAAAIALAEINSSDGGDKVDPEMKDLVVEEFLWREDVRAVISSADLWQNIAVGTGVTLLLALILACRCGKRRA